MGQSKGLNTIVAFFMIGFGLAFLYLAWYTIPNLMNYVDDSVVKSIHWIGFLIITAGWIIILPYYLLSTESKYEKVFGNAWKMIATYMAGWLFTTLSTYILPPLINGLTKATTSAENGQFLWLAYLGTFTIALVLEIILPSMRLIPQAQEGDYLGL